MRGEHLHNSQRIN